MSAPAQATVAPPPPALDVLAAAGLSVPAGTSVWDRSSSHRVSHVTLPDGATYVVKTTSERTRDSGRTLAAELYVYRLSTWVPGLADVVPRVVHLDERTQVLALVAAPAEHLFTSRCLEPGFPSPPVAASLGRALARLHTTTTQVPLLGRAAVGVVHLPRTQPEEWFAGETSASLRDAGTAVVADAALGAALTRAADALRPACLVHADLKWDNVAVAPGPRTTLFDWELSGRGDPAWDVGSALADTLALRVRLTGSTPSPVVDPSQRALLRAYADDAPWALGPAQTRPADDGGTSDDADLATRVTLCLVARTVQLAIECAGAAGDAAYPVVAHLLDAARWVCAHEADVRDSVASALAPG
ncbi:phosphotransferase family protein [Georgenia sp. Marseille-Q6866]